MQLVRNIPTGLVGKLRRTADRDENLTRYIAVEVEDYLSEMSGLYTRWQNYLRMYRGIPVESFSKDPIPIKNVEITVGATAVDTIYAQAWDLFFSQQPIVTVRGNGPGTADTAKAIQTLLNHLAVDNFVHFQEATKDFLMDDIQLGTAIFYTTWEENRKQTATEDITDWGPRIFTVAPEDFIVPGGTSPDIERARVIGYRNLFTGGELALQAKLGGWDNTVVAAPTRQMQAVRRQRLVSSHETETDHALIERFEIFELFVWWDYDGSGVDRDLYVVWDRTSKQILYLGYNPFDTRPFSIARYQYQPHVLHGEGVMEMGEPYESEVTGWHNFRMANAKLVNSRAWGVKIGSPMSGHKLRITPNKPLYFAKPDDLKEFRMADVYPSVLQYEGATMQLHDKRVGIMTNISALPSAGHRTPGITMLSMLQAINRRFSTAFGEMRTAMADSLVQCLLRMQEQFRLGANAQNQVLQGLVQLLGPEATNEVATLLRRPQRELRDSINVEMTASSQSINREADKQSSLQMLQALDNYYQKALQLAQVVANPQVPKPLKDLALKVAKQATEAMDRFIRTFDQVRDPGALLLSSEDFEALVQEQQQQGMPDLASLEQTMGAEDKQLPQEVSQESQGQALGGEEGNGLVQ